MLSDFYKENPESKIWLIDELDAVGPFYFNFDKKKSIIFGQIILIN
jgi:hypothetical protein